MYKRTTTQNTSVHIQNLMGMTNQKTILAHTLKNKSKHNAKDSKLQNKMTNAEGERKKDTN